MSEHRSACDLLYTREEIAAMLIGRVEHPTAAEMQEQAAAIAALDNVRGIPHPREHGPPSVLEFGIFDGP